MTEEPEATRGDAAWREQRDAVAKRNVEAHRRGQAEREQKDRAIGARDRVRAAQESDELDQLNKQIAKRRSGRAR
jgi:hypothetical protein